MGLIRSKKLKSLLDLMEIKDSKKSKGKKLLNLRDPRFCKELQKALENELEVRRA